MHSPVLVITPERLDQEALESLLWPWCHENPDRDFAGLHHLAGWEWLVIGGRYGDTLDPDGVDGRLVPGRDVLVARDGDAVLAALTGMGEAERVTLGAAGRARVLASHTAAHRAAELDGHIIEAGLR